jgi:cobalt-zinc-cadmium resistance protein CzcA
MTLLWIIWGTWSATKLPIDAVPDITNNQVQIFTSCPTLASQEVEQLVTFPIELGLANLPDIEEVRSISRFGLSVITVVFKDKVDIYFARQLIFEKLQEVKEQIPTGIGTPELAPVSTGLGEVYQYLLHPKPGSETKYNAKDLRTLQDWVVARQLAGTFGIAEINSFGGELKQYEVAVDPQRLRAMGVTIPEIFRALELNNENTGGAYIDKRPNAYFIRSVGLVTSLNDVKKIPVKSTNAIPILIGDVADVRFGAAIRYGALTYNGEVDAVGGVVMMLKGQNSHEVVQRIKEKMPTIQKSLPADIIIEPYLDRTDLVGRAIKTVEKNLIEGALIVIFVLVLFLGNLRAGLIVASAIPLSLLFALGMMHIFGVSANLMSLGAIDFGLIVDGAVIVVEATLHHIGRKTLTQEEMDREVYVSSSKIRNSAAFGEIIILMVYIPILSLSGVEGKMFGPMAKTVVFAILGALILSMTYIPMMCALFLPKKARTAVTLSDRIMEKLKGMYRPILEKALRIKTLLLATAVFLFIGSTYLFSRLGGEFIPQLQEGDFAFHCILPQGSSLEESIAISMKASRLLKEMDEVKMVVGKTGSAEVPTDPMPPEATDLMVILKPGIKRSYDELADEMMKKLEVIPGVFFEKNQPIQMRFNELMTGIRQDVAVKLFGENLDTLALLGQQTAALISTIPGATTPQLERTEGLPQINIEFDRARMANYGLSIKEVNQVISTAFAGQSAGKVFENERRFDLVVRLDSNYRRDIKDVALLMVPTPSGLQIPLEQVANVSYKTGPAQISREASKRRIVIGFNVQGRDVKSVVEEIKSKLESEIDLPSGYYFTYGGQFENLEKASKRLTIAVPLALFLIFGLLYFTFRSLKQAVLIFTAIPLSAIGGVFALMARDMPFSISAGIGFIALFGVAVLNGIVLIGTFNQLRLEGMQNPYDRVMEGTLIRLRPILMTATVASLGFLPMAISTGAGAEVQKPLATVVIGGLVSATLLTLFVLPALYLISSKPPRKAVVLALLLFAALPLSAQRRVNEEEAVQLAIKNSALLQVNSVALEKSSQNVKSAGELPKTGIFAENEDFRPSDTRGILKIGISQSLEWPGFYKARKNYYQSMEELEKRKGNYSEGLLRKQVQESYRTLWYLQEKEKLYQSMDSLYQDLAKAAEIREQTGESTTLERISSKARQKENATLRTQVLAEMSAEQEKLRAHVQEILLPLEVPLQLLLPRSVSNELPELLQIQEQEIVLAEKFWEQEKAAYKPDFSGRIFSQTLWGAKDPFTGFSVTASLPLGSGGKKRLQAVRTGIRLQEETMELEKRNWLAEREYAKAQMQKAKYRIDYFLEEGMEEVKFIEKSAGVQFKAGEISFTELNAYLNQALNLRLAYLEDMHAYNLAVIKFNYFNHHVE